MVNSFTTARRFNPSWPLMVGVALICIGVVCEILYHSLPVTLSHVIDPLVGADGLRAQVVTLVANWWRWLA